MSVLQDGNGAYMGVPKSIDDSASLEDLGLTKATITALHADEIVNVGQLWREFLYTDYLPQIGLKRKLEIAKALRKSGRLTRKPWTEHLLQALFNDRVDRKYILTPEGEKVLILRLVDWLSENSRNSMIWIMALRYGIGRFRWSTDFRVLNVEAMEDGRFTMTDPMTNLQVAEVCELTAHEVRVKMRAAMRILQRHRDEIWDIFQKYQIKID